MSATIGFGCAPFSCSRKCHRNHSSLNETSREIGIYVSWLEITKEISSKGACTYDVCTGRGRGGTPKADAVRNLSEGGCVKMQTRGRGSKNPKILQTSYVHGPQGWSADVLRDPTVPTNVVVHFVSTPTLHGIVWPKPTLGRERGFLFLSR